MMSPPTHFKLNTGALIPAVGLGASQITLRYTITDTVQEHGNPSLER